MSSLVGLLWAALMLAAVPRRQSFYSSACKPNALCAFPDPRIAAKHPSADGCRSEVAQNRSASAPPNSECTKTKCIMNKRIFDVNKPSKLHSSCARWAFIYTTEVNNEPTSA